MRKRDREITLLYGMSLIRDDVLNHKLPKLSTTDRLIILIHYLMNTGAITSLVMASFIMFITLIP